MYINIVIQSDYFKGKQSFSQKKIKLLDILFKNHLMSKKQIYFKNIFIYIYIYIYYYHILSYKLQTG